MKASSVSRRCWSTAWPSTCIGQGTRTETPVEDIGFDPTCITKTAPKARSGKPDIGAYAL